MRVLHIEDDAATAMSVELMLKSVGFNVYTTDLGAEGVDLASLYDYDIILLDLNLPDISGYVVLETIRKNGVPTPVLIVSGLAGIQDKVKGLTLGADDYLTKPFHKDELVARIHAIVRRTKGHATSVVSIHNLSIDYAMQKVRVDNQVIELTGKEYAVLEILTLRQGSVVSKQAILNHLYGGFNEPDKKIIDVYISKLRKKLTEAHCQVEIVTLWERGYVFNDSSLT